MFQYNENPADEQRAAVERVRGAFEALAQVIGEVVPDGRYRALVNTKLEEAAMFANKGITHS